MSNIPEPLDGEALRKEAQTWLGRIEDAKTREKTWRDDANKARIAYTGEGERTEAGQAEQGIAYDFNILHANVETIVPAVINSPPAPDIRRRFGAADPAAKDFAEMLERAMRIQVDDGRLQVEMEAMAQDGFLAGRGLIRMRFFSDFTGGETRTEEVEAHDAAARAERGVAPPVGQETANERVEFEAVSWRDAVHGPATRWANVPWWAFRHTMQREDLADFADRALVDAQDESDQGDEPDADRTVWEIWDKRSKTVTFVSEGAGTIIKQVPDPLGLSRFFPIATPVQPIEVTGRLTPVNPFSIYKRLADELDTTTKRIRVVTEQLRVKGAYSGDAAAIEMLIRAEDNEFIPIPDADRWAQSGGLERAIVFWPVDKLIAVLRELYGIRDQTKQAIYEITGISDIVRGASKSGETLGAQQIKTQWGSLRIQKFQRMMERAARDLFLMMADVIPAKFSPKTLQAMTDIQVEPSPEDMQPAQLPPQPQPTGDPQKDQQQAQAFQQAMTQAQAAEKARQAKVARLGQLQALMQQPVASYFRIDVETDSTVRADLTRQKEEATGFMSAASQYFTAVAPLVQQGMLPMNVAVEIFGSFARLFNLGKSVEDALEQLIQQATEAAGQPPKPNPAEEAQKAEAKAKSDAAALDLQMRQQDGAIKSQEAADNRALKQVDFQIRQTTLAIERVKLAQAQGELFRPPEMGLPEPGAYVNA